MTPLRALAWTWWGLRWIWWVITTGPIWVRWRVSWWRYELAWRADARRQRRLHRQMWDHYQRTGQPMVTDR